MKIKLEKKVSTTEEVEIDLPAYFKNQLGWYYAFHEEGVIEVNVNYCRTGATEKFSKELQELLEGKWKAERCTESEFNDAYVSFLERCNAITGMLTEI